MNTKKPVRFSPHFVFVILLLGLVTLACVTLVPRGGVLAQAPETPALAREDLAGSAARSKQMLPGRVDIYLDNSQLDVASPGIANVKFADLVGLNGKNLLLFSDGKGSHWLMDPDRVITFRAYNE